MERDPYERFWQQFDEVCDKQPGKRFTVSPPEARPGSGIAPEIVYETGRMLCRTEHVEGVRAHLDPLGAGFEEMSPALTMITVPDDVDIPAHVRAANAAFAAVPGAPVPAPLAPNHLVSIAPVNLCPADEPVPVARDAEPWPPRVLDPGVGQGIDILVVDTGLIPDHLTGHPWLAGVVPPQPGDTTVLRRPFRDDGLIKEYSGHGTFIAGVIGAAAPGATIHLSNALQNGGALLETELGAILLDVLGAMPRWPHIISLSAGAPTLDGQPLMGLEGFLAELDRHPETVLIAAAGNDAKRDDRDNGAYHFWPAAYAPHRPGVISVGALARHHDGRACFTNHGSSVTVYARGEEHVNAFLTGEYEYHHGLDPACHNYVPPLYCPCSCVTSVPWHGHAMFQGMARWSGTSFATPLVAGMVAAHMTETGEHHNARTAAHDLIGKRARLIGDVDGEQLSAFL